MHKKIEEVNCGNYALKFTILLNKVPYHNKCCSIRNVTNYNSAVVVTEPIDSHLLKYLCNQCRIINIYSVGTIKEK